MFSHVFCSYCWVYADQSTHSVGTKRRNLNYIHLLLVLCDYTYLQTCCSLSTFCLLAWTSLCQTAGSTPSGMCCSSSNSSIARSKLRTASEFAREDQGLGPNGLPLSGRSPCDSVAALSCFCPLRKKKYHSENVDLSPLTNYKIVTYFD